MYFFLSSFGNWMEKADDQVVSNVIGVERSVIGNVLNFIRIFGTGVALIMLTYMSISYFATDGKSLPWSIERKADVKGRQLFNFAIGAVVFIGASNILYFLSDFIADIFVAATTH